MFFESVVSKMCENGHHFVEWKEHFVSQERGNRVVHYFLKDSTGENVLAVVGTERSVRHMFYVVSEEFVRVYGAENSIHAGFKWRSRREVVDWLTSMLSKQNSKGDWSRQSLGSSEIPTNGAIAQRAQAANEMGHLHVNFSMHTWDIVWSGTAWTCGKQLKHFPSFCRNGTTIKAHSFVFVMGKGEDRYVAYLEDMYEDKRGQKKVKVRWFHHTKEVKSIFPLRNLNPKEVFITPHAQVISAECIDGPATILTREHYEECLASFPNALLARVHMCFRQFRKNKVKSFDLSKLRGYFDQPILSCLSSTPLMEPESVGRGLNGGEKQKHSEGEQVKLGSKDPKRGQEHLTCDYPLRTFGSSRKKLKFGVSGKGYPSLTYVETHSCYNTVLKVDGKIELLCQDSGIRGCWFRCTVLEVSRKKIRVQYEDIQDEDGYGNLEEWVPAFKLAQPDKLGMRTSDRPTVRPTPPDAKTTDSCLLVGTAVDAWWKDGWWEGVVTESENAITNTLQIYSPGENLFLTIDKNNLRISRDWVGDQWVDIDSKPNIRSIISSAISPETKASTSSTFGKDIEDQNQVNFLQDGKEKDEDQGYSQDDGRKPSHSKEEDNGVGSNGLSVGLNHENSVLAYNENEISINDEGKRSEENGGTSGKSCLEGTT